ncbi:hypothetical protein HIM_12501 [Hirsutella minnesotensis 3608]|uniref:Heme haloperoxidase family profile domain-containing protein n=1 Tax=Hirsutella minnesotensis 3608 TaxID=1043627 RepID=A0A0F7ZW00_9HYPO|nr:hypothetical protein HIM_12501 [Hirsutella minnesotensis 3608]
MKLLLHSQLALILPVAVGAFHRPVIRLDDPRFLDYRPPRPGDVRTSCPGLNTLANHGFLPRNGRGINLTSLMVAAFEGLGVSPETTGLITLAGLIESGNPVNHVFSLADVHMSNWGIEHDGSLSRKDRAEDPDVTRFDPDTWEVTYNELRKTPLINAIDFGRARAVRVKNQRRMNPSFNYNSRVASTSAAEIAKLMLTLGNMNGWVKLEYLQPFFEEERFPYHLGWRPHWFSADIASALGTAAFVLAADPNTLSRTSDGTVSLPSDILSRIAPKNISMTRGLIQIIRDAGFDHPAPFDEINRITSGRSLLLY